MRTIPPWAKSALVGGQFYRRTLVPSVWLRESGPSQAGNSPLEMSPEEVTEFVGHVAFYREGER